MAIEKKLICFARLEEFERQLAAGNILGRSIVFIQDAKKIWTHGTYYDCSESVSPDADNVYITDFTVNDLENNIGSGLDVVADLTSLEEALAAHKVILVPYNAGDGYIGYGLLVGYAEDLLYCAVYTGFDGLFYEIEATRGETVIRDQSILKRTWSDKQDKLVSGTNIKTINGTSILGSGNIEIESGEANVQSDWNVTDTSSDAYIKNKPTIPTKTSQLINDKGYLDRTAGDQSYIKAEKVGESVYAYINGLTDEAMYYALPTSANGDEDDILLSQLTVKTINGESIVGSGNITISGGSSKDVVQVPSSTGVVNDMLSNTIYVSNIDIAMSSLKIYSFSTTSELYEEYQAIVRFHNTIPIEGPVTISLPTNVIWANGKIPELPTLQQGESIIYELSVAKTTLDGVDYFKAVLVPFKSV